MLAPISSIHSLVENVKIPLCLPLCLLLWGNSSLPLTVADLHCSAVQISHYSDCQEILLLALNFKLMYSCPLDGHWSLLFPFYLAFDICLLLIVAPEKSYSLKLSLSQRVYNLLSTLIFGNCYFPVTFSDPNSHEVTPNLSISSWPYNLL